VSNGLISAIRKISDQLVVLQISAPIAPGSSGGPILDERGDVIGVATAFSTPPIDVQGAGQGAVGRPRAGGDLAGPGRTSVGEARRVRRSSGGDPSPAEDADPLVPPAGTSSTTGQPGSRSGTHCWPAVLARTTEALCRSGRVWHGAGPSKKLGAVAKWLGIGLQNRHTWVQIPSAPLPEHRDIAAVPENLARLFVGHEEAVQ
jgi:hypothetical protein